jgi:hypothetical protein
MFSAVVLALDLAPALRIWRSDCFVDLMLVSRSGFCRWPPTFGLLLPPFDIFFDFWLLWLEYLPFDDCSTWPEGPCAAEEAPAAGPLLG